MRVVIMGGTAGIGLATAERLTGNGAEVIVTGRDAERLAAARGRVFAAEELDATDEDGVAEFFDRTGAFDHLVLVFSPGAVGAGPLRDVALAEVRAMFDGKFFPYLHAVQRAKVTESITFISAASSLSLGIRCPMPYLPSRTLSFNSASTCSRVKVPFIGAFPRCAVHPSTHPS